MMNTPGIPARLHRCADRSVVRATRQRSTDRNQRTRGVSDATGFEGVCRGMCAAASCGSGACADHGGAVERPTGFTVLPQRHERGLLQGSVVAGGPWVERETGVIDPGILNSFREGRFQREGPVTIHLKSTGNPVSTSVWDLKGRLVGDGAAGALAAGSCFLKGSSLVDGSRDEERRRVHSYL